VSIDVRVPAVCQLYNMATLNAWEDGWGKCSLSPYRVWREAEFREGAWTYQDRMEPEADDMEEAFPREDEEDATSLVMLDQNLPFQCNAFWFNNAFLRLFGTVDPTLSSDSIESDGWTGVTLDIYDNALNHGKARDEWCITCGFTHPRPHNDMAVLLYKNRSLEVRIRADYDYLRSDEKHKRGHLYKLETLEVFLIYSNKGGKRDKVLSVPIRSKFDEDYLIYDGDMVAVGDECVQSHVLILAKDRKVFKAFLDGKKVCEKKLVGNASTHLLQKSVNEVNNDMPFQLMVGHKRTGDDGQGRCVNYFHGYIYDVGVWAYCPHEFELNLMYRMMKLDHNIHLTQHWQEQRDKFEAENAMLNVSKFDDD